MDGASAALSAESARVIDGLGRSPVPAGPYYRDDYFELEREAVFKRAWLQIGHVCEVKLSGDFIVRDVDIARTSVIIVRGKDDVIRAFHNVCPHRGTQLVSQRAGHQSSFSCPYHAWSFGLDGALRGAPDFESFYVEKADCGLKPIASDVCGGLIFINLDPAPRQDLKAYLGPLAQALGTLAAARATTISEYVYEIDANWKLTYDNFQENYHLRFIHPRSGAAAIGEDNPFGYPTSYGFHGPHRTQRIWSNPKPPITPVQGVAFGKQAAFAAADGFANSAQGKDYYAIFPNFFMLGSPVQPFSHCVTPISATRSRGVIRLYWIGEDQNASQRFAREYAMASARDIHAEDRSVIEAGQRGLLSGALDYIHFQKNEVLCRHLFASVDAWVGAYQAERAHG
jgi:phenylpropionate dioxygenase-like ring-hydroxylating dioxygenase large terminal subunit